MADPQSTPTAPGEPVDAEAYAAHLARLDRIGREALAADPAAAITLVREASELVGELLPMHRGLMAELAHHRDTLQAACDELASEGGLPPSDAPAGPGAAETRDTDAIPAIDSDGEGLPF